MKHVQGDQLDIVVRDVGPLPIAMTQAILAQVATRSAMRIAMA